MNDIRHILLHIDSSQQALNRLSLCRSLAARFKAHVTALYAVTPWLMLYPVAMDGSGELATQVSEWDEQRLNRTRERIVKAMGGDTAIRWASLEGQSPFDFAKEALCADLMVLGRRDASDPAWDDVPPDFLAHAIVRSGKPALVLPPDHQEVQAAQVVLVAWDGRRESASALTAALPFMREAREVHICHFHDGEPEGAGLDSLASYLRLHDIEALVHSTRAGTADTGRMLLNQARELGTDLLVMGCYGHSRAREWMLGGTTRTVLKEATLPLLMAH